MSELPASILTSTQREYVTGEREPSNTRVFEKRVRDRIEAGMIDMTLLSSSYDNTQIRRGFEGFAPEISKYDETQDKIPTGGQGGAFAPGAIAFLIAGLNKGEPIDPIIENKDGGEQPALSEFRKAVEQGVQNYLAENSRYLADVSVSIELDNMDHVDDFDSAPQENGEK